MADFQAHINQAKKNLTILSDTNKHVPDSWDWQVTIAYYVAIHLMNAHLAKSANIHYTTHDKVKNALFNDMSPCKIPDDIYLAYVKLENLSRRARYLCHEENRDQPELSFTTHDIHLKRALQRLDKTLTYFSSKYNVQFTSVNIDCIEIKTLSLNHFIYKIK